jgi:hypothetical protein
MLWPFCKHCGNAHYRPRATKYVKGEFSVFVVFQWLCCTSSARIKRGLIVHEVLHAFDDQLKSIKIVYSYLNFMNFSNVPSFSHNSIMTKSYWAPNMNKLKTRRKMRQILF